ncbi:SDR family NAD(P)-dependent oxidoreductase [Marinilabiliaceae bacterium JC017]|nr:SDR family NAD(P)-dependent oxidoreductase [Marinilabiliaceae bacterium JC017]
MKNIGVILAGGSGSRFGADKPKQFIRVAGKKIIEHTIEVFQECKGIDEIAVVTHAGYIEEVEDLINQAGFSKVKKVLNGGTTRNDSSLSAINAYAQEYDADQVNLIFHDAVRPFLSEQILQDIFEAMEKYDAIDVAIPSTDTIIEVENDLIRNIPDRSYLMNGQTPQAFRLSVIKKAYDVALKDPKFKATDDCGVVKKYLPGVPIFVVKGDESNLKITYGLDLFVSDKVFQLKHKKSTVVDPALLAGKVVVVFGGNEGIGKEVAGICEREGAQVACFSRRLNGVDICDKEKVGEALDQTHKAFGRIDYVVNSAAILKQQPLALMDYDTVGQLLDINLKGAVNVAKESFRYLKESQGQLLFYTSSSYTRGRANYCLYSATKAAIVNLTQGLAEEWREFDIRVNCINPERTETPMRVKNFGIEPEGSLLKAETVGKASVNVLLHDYTGQTIYVKNMEAK